MKKMMKKVFSVVLVAALICSLAACSKSSGTEKTEETNSVTEQSNETKTTPEETTLKIYMFNQPENFDKVLDKFYEETKDTLNIKLDFIFSDASTHREKIPLMMSNQEDADLVFDAFWMNLSMLQSQGAYASLNEYFNNDKYPGLKAAFSSDYLQQVTDKDGNIFAIPFTQAAEDIPVIYLRKDLREKYGMDPISSNEELMQYYDYVMDDIASGNSDMIAAIGVGGTRAFYYLDLDFYQKRAANVYTIDSTCFGVGMEMEAAVSEDGKTVLGVGTLGDPDEMFADFPAPYNTNTRNDRVINSLTKWGSYAQADAQTETDAKTNLFFTGKVASVEGNISNYTDMEKAIRDIGGEVEVYVYTDIMRNQEQVVTAPRTAWNFLCVPTQSKKKDQAMQFINWLFERQDNHDLFELGIEGEDWKAIGEDAYESLTPANKYSFPGYEMTWNPNFIRTNDSLPEEAKNIVKYQNNPNTYIASAITGFSFDANATPKLKTAIATVQAVQSDYQPILMLGLMKTPEATEQTLNEYHDKAVAAGLDVIREAVKTQLQEYLDRINQ